MLDYFLLFRIQGIQDIPCIPHREGGERKDYQQRLKNKLVLIANMTREVRNKYRSTAAQAHKYEGKKKKSTRYLVHKNVTLHYLETQRNWINKSCSAAKSAALNPTRYLIYVSPCILCWPMRNAAQGWCYNEVRILGPLPVL